MPKDKVSDEPEDDGGQEQVEELHGEPAAELDDEAAEASLPGLSTDTLMVDVRDALLMQVQTLQKPWQQMTEDEQRGCANVLEAVAKNLVRQTVRIIGAVDFPHVVVGLGDVKVRGDGKGIEAKVTCPNIRENREALGDYVGQMVTLYMADSEDFMAARDAKIDHDQADLLPEYGAD